ncbi:uncharacterized protein LOC129582876 [Paramacrobiotus metropolitanus]|uniref:uncharacterized protein LOC129582876 n=1 Tax=Paramacrobiotus metropolitanus TaxID=2943436 RepID=UPI00244624DF|nr:uncharacterized protein LOC129582876 [Paramacrobiotus metropolitanus]
MKFPEARISLEGRRFGCALWDALEAALAVPPAAQLAWLSLHVAGLSQPPIEPPIGEKREILWVCQIVSSVQTADPRPGSHYHGKEWFEAILGDLQLEKLSRMSLHFLAQIRS